MKRIFAIASGKGGTGTTTLAIALGAALVEQGADTTLIDANLSTPNVGLHLGNSNVLVGLHDALMQPSKFRDTIHQHAQSGLKVVPGKTAVTVVNHRDLLKLQSLIQGLSSPVVLLDTATGLHPETLAALAIADEAIMVTTPELPAVIDTLKLIKKSQALGTPVRGVILNRTRQHAHELFPGNVQALLGVPVLASIPNDVAVSEALHVRHPVTYSHPDSPAARTIKEVAALLLT